MILSQTWLNQVYYAQHNYICRKNIFCAPCILIQFLFPINYYLISLIKYINLSFKSKIFNLFIRFTGNTTYWISGTDLGPFNYKFNWMGSGESISFTNWEHEPSGLGNNCIAYLSNGMWINEFCYNIKNYICEKRLSDCS